MADINPLELAESELKVALQQRDALDQKIDALEKSIKLLRPIYSPDESGIAIAATKAAIANLGTTEAVRRVLMLHPGMPLPPTSIRNMLSEAGFNFPGLNTNIMALIHQTLKRIVLLPGSPFESAEMQGQTLYWYDPGKVPMMPVGPPLDFGKKIGPVSPPTDFGKKK